MPSDAALYEWFRITIFACFIYLLLNYAIFFVFAVVAAVENGLRHLQARAEDFDTLALSRFTIPVSVLVPAYDEASVITDSVESLLDIDYPEFEVIVVNDGSDDDTLERLKTRFDLEPRQVFYRKVFTTERIRAVYRSRREPRLLVVDKENGGKSDALNCAVNFSRYRYLCCVDADSFYDRGALLQSMRLALRDPARVVGVTSPVAISSHPERWHHTDVGKKRIDPRLLASFQHLDFLRSFLNNRVVWSRWKFMLCSIGAFSVWRRDVVVELGGFSRNFTCEDIEMTFRVHQRYLAEKRPYEILCMPEVAAVTEGPDKIRNLIRQRARWQRVISETLWSYRRMLFNPRYKTVGLIGMPYYLLYEGAVPFVELIAFASLPLAWWLGVIAWLPLCLFVGTICLANGVLTNWALFSEDRRAHRYTIPALLGFVFLGLVEYLLYRPLIFVARWHGFIGFLRGDKRWHKFERNRRPAKKSVP